MITQVHKTGICNYITDSFGTIIYPEQWFELEAKIKNVCLELHIRDWESFAKSIPTLSPKSSEMETLACHLSVGETYFFREKNALDLFKNSIVPKLIKENASSRTINIWSAGCCSGEEPYTLAMILRESIDNIDDWNINILATDISQIFLQKATTGLYTPWSFRNTPDWAMKKYFTKVDRKFQISETIRNMVTFKRMNLVDKDAFPSIGIALWSMDVIFCRNVFIYFPTEQIRNIALRFRRCLKEEGWLITSPVEVSNDGLNSLRYEWYPGVGVLRKDSSCKGENTTPPVSSNLKTHMDAGSDKPAKKVYVTYKQKSNGNINQLRIETDQLLAKAQNSFQQGQYCEASSGIHEVLKLSPNHSGAQILQARIFANLGDHHGAIVILDNLLERKKNDSFVYFLLASMYMETEQHDLSEKALRQALYLNPDMVAAQFLMGNLMQAKGNKRMSSKYFSKLKKCLDQYDKDVLLPELDGMTTGALAEIVNCLV